MAAWPGTLPSPISDGYQEIFANNVIRTEMDVGIAKIRKRSTAAPVNFQLVYNMTAAQVTTLETFYETTTNFGADTFTMANPRTGTTENFRFVSPPQLSIPTGVRYRVSIQFEQVP